MAQLIAESPHNLVSRRERELVASVHLPEAAAVGALLPIQAGQRWMDLGTGGGLPGLVLALAAPATEWVLLDSTTKKVEAVRGFAAELDLGNVTVIDRRAESAGHDRLLRGAFDGVVARAVAPLRVLAELARGFVRPEGTLGAIKGPAWEEEVRAARRACAVLRWTQPTAVHVPSAVRPTWLVTLRAVGSPPARYPRREGIPRGQPL